MEMNRKNNLQTEPYDTNAVPSEWLNAKKTHHLGHWLHQSASIHTNSKFMVL